MYDAAFAALEISRPFRNVLESNMSDLMKTLLANAGLNTASFSQEEFETPVDEVIAAATGEEDVLAEDVATIEEDSEELDAQVSDLDTAGEAAEELDDVAISLESMIADGGLDQRTHGYVMTTAAAILKQVRVSVPNIGLSQESFDTTEGRVRAATMTMEGFKETVAKMWAAIKNGIDKVRTFLKNLWVKLTSAATRLRKKAIALNDRVKSYGNASANARGKLAMPTSVMKVLGKDATTGAAVKGYAAALNTATTSVLETYSKALNTFIKDAVVSGKAAADSGVPVPNINSAALPRGPKFEKAGEESFGYVLKLGEKTSLDKADKKGEAEAFSVSDMGSICVSVKAAMETVEHYERAWKDTDSAIDAMVKKLDAQVKAAGESEKEGLKDNLKAARKASSAAAQAPTKFASYACSIANGCLTAVAWSLGAYK